MIEENARQCKKGQSVLTHTHTTHVPHSAPVQRIKSINAIIMDAALSSSSAAAAASLELRVAECVAKIAARATHKQGMEEMLLLLEDDVGDDAQVAQVVRALARELHTSGDHPQAARAELVSLLGLLGEMFGPALGASSVTRAVAALLERLRVDGDSTVAQAVADALATLCAEVGAPSSAGAACDEPFERAALLDTFVAPLFRLMREPHATAQAGAARALVAVLQRFPDAAALEGAFAKIAVPLVKLYEQRDFGSRLHVLEALGALVERCQGDALDEGRARRAGTPLCTRGGACHEPAPQAAPVAHARGRRAVAAGGGGPTGRDGDA